MKWDRTARSVGADGGLFSRVKDKQGCGAIGNFGLNKKMCVRCGSAYTVGGRTKVGACRVVHDAPIPVQCTRDCTKLPTHQCRGGARRQAR